MTETDDEEASVTESEKKMRLETQVLHSGSLDPSPGGAVVSPIFQSANFLMADESTYDAVRYIRLSNTPNHHVLNDRMAALESAESAMVCASGMAAISSVFLSLLKPGDHVLVQKTVYGGTQSLLDHDLAKWGIEQTAIDPCEPESWSASLRPETRLIYVESISNPLVEVGDLAAAVAFAREHGLTSVIDNTFASPVNFRPAELGFDLIMHSATKYLNGHSDIVAGVLAGRAELVDQAKAYQLHLGASLDPHACFLLERGLKTLALRVGRQNENALELAQFLAGHPKVRQVRYPGLPDDPGHAMARKFFCGFGGMLSFYAADAAVAERFLDRVELPFHAASLGGVESLVVRPARSSHLGLTEEQRQELGITDDLVRVSVGVESIDDLIEDFDRALS